MDNEKIKAIDKMYEDIPSFVGNEHRYGMCVHHRELVAETLVNKGYGNIEQALTKFAEKLKADFYDVNYTVVRNVIDATLKEFFRK